MGLRTESDAQCSAYDWGALEVSSFQPRTRLASFRDSSRARGEVRNILPEELRERLQ